MRQEPIELILLKQWASYVTVPIWIADADGNLIYYNEPAEWVLGRPFDDAGEIPAEEIADLFLTTDTHGRRVAGRELALATALAEKTPVHRVLRIQALDGSSRLIEVTAIPIMGQDGHLRGAMATFWEPK